MTTGRRSSGQGPLAALTHPHFAAALLLAGLAGIVGVDMRSVPAVASGSNPSVLSGGRAALAPGGGLRPAAGPHHHQPGTANGGGSRPGATHVVGWSTHGKAPAAAAVPGTGTATTGSTPATDGPASATDGPASGSVPASAGPGRTAAPTT